VARRTHIGTAVAVVLLAAICQSAAAGDAPVVRADDLKHAVRAYVAALAGGEQDDMELTFRSVPDSVRVKSPDFTLHVERGRSLRLKGAVAFAVTVECGGVIGQSCMVTALIRTYADVYVAMQMIPWRTTLSWENYRVYRMETTFIERPVIRDTLQMQGLRTRRIVAQGSILYEDMFEPVPLIMQGDRVSVLVRAGSVMLTAEGVAREDGHQGEMIQVSIQGRGERLKARVQSERTVAVTVE
jgi:flagella basal body P-ring formation protein FlgA